MIVAQQFTAGKRLRNLQSMKRTSPWGPGDPSDESLGYFHPSAKRGLTDADFSDKAKA